MLINVDEDRFVGIIVKPRFILSTPLKERENLEDYLSKKYSKQIYLINRLDYLAYGLVAFTNSYQFRQKIRGEWSNANKKYMILTKKALPIGKHTFFCKRVGHKVIIWQDSLSTVCISEVLSSKPWGNYFISFLKNYTGFTHQIRLLAKRFNTVIIGDTLYGDSLDNNFPGLALEAIELKLPSWTIEGRTTVIKRKVSLSLEMKRFLIEAIRWG